MRKIGFIGAGNMAGALVRGLVRAKKVAARDMWASDAVPAQLQRLRRTHKIAVTRDNLELVRGSGIVVLAVKPQVLEQVLTEIRPVVSPRTLFISIAAGFPLARLEAGLGGSARVVRVMPNTPALVGRGVSVAVAGAHARAADLKRTLRLFRAVGEAYPVDDEGLIDAVTALSGSGPAFVYRFAEMLIAGGCHGGLGSTLAARLAFGTLAGAAAMLIETGKTPQELREMVSSPGGTTLAGLAALEANGFERAVLAALEAAARRARELAAA